MSELLTDACYEDLKIVDSSGTLLFDLDTGDDDVAAAGNPYDVKTSAGPPQVGRLPVALGPNAHGAGIPGAIPGVRDYGLRTFGFTVTIKAGSVSDADAAANELGRLINEGSAKGNRLLYVVDSTLPDRYVRWLGVNELPPLIEDKSLTLLSEGKIVMLAVALVAQPLLERAEQTITPQSVPADPADTGGRVALIDNPGSGPGRVRMKVATAAASVPSGALKRILWGLVTQEAAAFQGVKGVMQAETMTPGTDASLASRTSGISASGAGNNVITVSFATAAEALRASVAYTGPALDSLLGRRVMVVLRGRATAGTVSGTIRLEYGPGSFTDSWIPLDTIDYSFTATGSHFALGVVSVGEDWDALNLRIYASRDGASNGIDLDYLAFIPVDEAAGIMESPETVDESYAYVTSPPGLGLPPFVGVEDASGNLVSTNLTVIGDVALWVPPGASGVVIQGDDSEGAAGHWNHSLERDVTVTFYLTPTDLLA